MDTPDKNMRNISFKISEKDYEAIKNFAKEKRKMSLKGYLMWLAKEDMKQPDFEIKEDDTETEKTKKLEQLVDLQKKEIDTYIKILNTIEFAIDSYKK